MGGRCDDACGCSQQGQGTRSRWASRKATAHGQISDTCYVRDVGGKTTSSWTKMAATPRTTMRSILVVKNFSGCVKKRLHSRNTATSVWSALNTWTRWWAWQVLCFRLFWPRWSERCFFLYKKCFPLFLCVSTFSRVVRTVLLQFWYTPVS